MFASRCVAILKSASKDEGLGQVKRPFLQGNREYVLVCLLCSVLDMGDGLPRIVSSNVAVSWNSGTQAPPNALQSPEPTNQGESVYIHWL